MKKIKAPNDCLLMIVECKMECAARNLYTQIFIVFLKLTKTNFELNLKYYIVLNMRIKM